jgi:hypothetical protein
MRFLRSLALAAVSLAAATALAQMKNDEAFHYKGPDREARLAAQAKKEG